MRETAAAAVAAGFAGARPAGDVVRKWQKQSGQKVYEKPIVRTDCHGDHRLKTRSVRYQLSII